mmetsp:Transcript_27726/g.88276  ORF Transcript_27726/g.88276 Transcript_27726/m.88276 type:complete len:209 (+) Transcript_27726:1582-2208(+)
MRRVRNVLARRPPTFARVFAPPSARHHPSPAPPAEPLLVWSSASNARTGGGVDGRLRGALEHLCGCKGHARRLRRQKVASAQGHQLRERLLPREQATVLVEPSEAYVWESRTNHEPRRVSDGEDLGARILVDQTAASGWRRAEGGGGTSRAGADSRGRTGAQHGGFGRSARTERLDSSTAALGLPLCLAGKFMLSVVGHVGPVTAAKA